MPTADGTLEDSGVVSPGFDSDKLENGHSDFGTRRETTKSL